MAGNGDTTPIVNRDSGPIGFEGLTADHEDIELGRVQNPGEKDDNYFFRDGPGLKSIDFVIVSFKPEDGSEREQKKQDKRERFQKNLVEEGLELEIDDPQVSKDDDDPAKILIKIHVPWKTMLQRAEEFKYKKPIAKIDIEEQRTVSGTVSKVFKSAWSFVNPFQATIKPDTQYFTAQFSLERQDEFFDFHRQILGGDIEQTFFTPAERSRIVNEILEVTRYDIEGSGEKRFGVERLVGNGCYAGAFPLHEGSAKIDEDDDDPPNDRSRLYEEWARPGRWWKMQPLDTIRSYYGEKIGIYFAWLGFYTEMLTYAALVGFIVFIYGCINLASGRAEVSNDLCMDDKPGDPGNIVMCPQCSNPGCPYWLLSSSCYFAMLTYLFDNEATVFFAAFMSLWATTFCEFWKRRQNELAYKWDLFGVEDQEENCRPEYQARAKGGDNKRVNPVTQIEEAYISLFKRAPRFFTAVLSITFMVFLVVASVMGIIVYRIAVKVIFATQDDAFVSSQASIFTSITASVISLIVIMVLQILYNKVAIFLTDFELHRTDTEYEDSFTFKMYLFAFVNYYSSSFYIAFVKGALPGSPANYGKIFGFRQEECDPAGCLQELFINIAIVMCGKQFFNNFMEICVPIALNFWRRRSLKKQENETGQEVKQWEKDFSLGQLDNRGLFSEYLEMVVQFGFTTIFVAAFPLAPLFALINNLMEIRLDAYKFCTQLRRPLATRAQDIGVWYAILVAIGNLAVLTNACVIAFTSEFIPREVYRFSRGNFNNSLKGYMNFSLSYFNVSDFEYIDGRVSMPDVTTHPLNSSQPVEVCRYRGFYTSYDDEEPYERTLRHWQILALKLVFVILYEHVIFAFKFALDYLIPDVPEHVQNAIKRENFLAQEALHKLASHHAKQAQNGGVVAAR